MCLKTSLKLYFCSSTLLRFYHLQNSHTSQTSFIHILTDYIFSAISVVFILVHRVFDAKKIDEDKKKRKRCHVYLSSVPYILHHRLNVIVYLLLSLCTDFGIVTISIFHYIFAQTRIEKYNIYIIDKRIIKYHHEIAYTIDIIFPCFGVFFPTFFAYMKGWFSARFFLSLMHSSV